MNAESATFYEAEYIDNIYMSKYQYSNQTTYYQKARFFRKTGTNEFAYCIEPLNFFNENSTYESTISPSYLSEYQKEMIKRIAYFGYGYKNHTDVKWYAITQLMIWQYAEPSRGKYYFTDTLNGSIINPYNQEKNEILSLVNNYGTLPNTNNNTYIIRENQTLTIDGGEVLSNFSSNDPHITINGSELTISNLEEGEYEFELSRNDYNYNKPLIFYQSSNSQDMLKTGDLGTTISKFNVKVLKTEIEIIKKDKDTEDVLPKGEGELDGATISLYDNNMELIDDFVVKSNKIKIENIDFGKYYLKEKEPGKGYTLDETIYEINITETNPKQSIDIYNKIIEKNITIIKKYGDNINLNAEKNIDFEIYDINDNLISTISTNENGEASIILPYGKYKFVQVNSTPGYKKVESFIIDISNTEDEVIELKDYKIPVPNTHTNYLILILHILLLIL